MSETISVSIVGTATESENKDSVHMELSSGHDTHNANSGRIKIEKEGVVKTEAGLKECLLCLSKSDDYYDIYWTETSCSHTTLYLFICKSTNVTLENRPMFSKYICKTCNELINILEKAEVEYTKCKESFESIISRNPLFDDTLNGIEVNVVKSENCNGDFYTPLNVELNLRHEDSDDEPLAIARKKRGRKPSKKKKKCPAPKSKAKRGPKTIVKVSQEEPEWFACAECGEQFEGRSAGVVHVFVAHHIDFAVRPEALVPVDTLHRESKGSPKTRPKKEERSNSIHIEDMDTGFDYSDDDADWPSDPKDNFNDGNENEQPSATLNDSSKDETDESSQNGKRKRTIKERKKRSTKRDLGSRILGELSEEGRKRTVAERKRNKTLPKVMYPCKECNAKYSTQVRLKFHMAKHDGSKPPYICEICGAHYKHKKACDIHVEMHKGISDWKCEECNKIFPSKGALNRHNNIHTGKPNYQCDLCGKSFIHTSSFKMHKLSHTGLKPHSCDVCGLALMTRSHLKRHKRVHSGEKRHECSICGKKFSERYNLLAHTKAHQEVPSSPAMAAPPRRRMFRCTLCESRFERRYMLEKHMEMEHQRIMEKGPPKPRNTLTKLLKAQAAAASKTSDSIAQQNQILREALQKTEVECKPEPKPYVLVVSAGGEETKGSSSGKGDRGEAMKSSPQSGSPTLRPVVITTDVGGLAFQESVRAANASWGGPVYNVSSEYSLRLPDFSQ